MFINPWTYYLINEPENIPDITPHNDDEAKGCLAGVCGFLIATVIYALLIHLILTYKLKECFNTNVYMLLMLVASAIVFPILTILLMKLGFKIVDKLNHDRN